MSNNFRPYLLSLSLLVGVAVPWVAAVQAPVSNISSDSVGNQLTQLEHISNAHSQLLTQLQQQLADNQRDIDLLRGQIQENQYQLSQAVERQKKIYQYMDSLSSQTPTAFQNGKLLGTSTSVNDGSQDTTLTARAVTAGNCDANTDYNEAVTLVLEKKQYNQAISMFRNFIKRYPDSTCQPNANYWLGQLNYNQGRKDDALYYFAIVAKIYPKSPKAPDALLKVGIIMQEKDQKDKALAVYQQVKKLYPSAEAAKQAQKRLAAL